MSNNKNKTKSFSMRSNFQIQERPRHQWKVVQMFTENIGGLNGGIAKVELVGDPIDRYFIEKSCRAEDVRNDWFAAKEITLMQQLKDHDHIVKMVDHFLNKKNKRSSIYMEFCDAGDLQAVVRAVMFKRQQVSERTIWKWFIGCFDALAYMHYGPKPDDQVFSRKYWNQVYHRDLKPGNVFLKLDKEKKEIVVKLADFGCSISDQYAKLNKSRETASRTSAHTQGFDPPEHPEFSVATDVWQLALCIVCVCTGIADPRSGTHPGGVEWDKQQPAGQRYTRELNDMLKWCLTVDKKRRPNAWEILKRLRENYSQVKDSLPRDERPMDVFWQSEIDRRIKGKDENPASSPGPRAADLQQEFQEHRPGLSGHAFSNPGAERMEHMGNRYTDMVREQRRAMSPSSIDEIINGGGGYGRYGMPGGYDPSRTPGGYDQHARSGGYGQSGLPGGFVPGFGRGFGRGGGHGGYFDPRSGPGWC